ncbi:MAG: hypothetical protein J4203_00870 [Candidatus Diapherotrites archaeon]|uniref:Uncharacterized protein n=2 Tax=Candidatus Iainarchaeum sp. TaxID=3101447 RepID=A0A8T4L524_9ARCH|nr:hypothetical protein [Candidatus Diapherotrites archaeon]
MYHLARVLRVFKADEKEVLGADNTVQAMVETWDENVFTFMVHPMLNDKVRSHDIVLVEYDFMGGNRQPRQTIVKVLRGKAAEEGWKKMSSYLDQMKKRHTQAPSQPFDLALPLNPQDNMVR